VVVVVVVVEVEVEIGVEANEEDKQVEVDAGGRLSYIFPNSISRRILIPTFLKIWCLFAIPSKNL
jgi:hypothetical protein